MLPVEELLSELPQEARAVAARRAAAMEAKIRFVIFLLTFFSINDCELMLVKFFSTDHYYNQILFFKKALFCGIWEIGVALFCELSKKLHNERSFILLDCI